MKSSITACQSFLLFFQNATSEGLDLELEDPFEAQGAISGFEKRSLPTISSSGVETLDMDLKNLSIRYPQFDSLDEHILSQELDKVSPELCIPSVNDINSYIWFYTVAKIKNLLRGQG